MTLSDICSYTFYLLLHLTTYTLLFSLNDTFPTKFSITYQFFLYITSIISYILLIITKYNPGIITESLPSLNVDSSIELQPKHTTQSESSPLSEKPITNSLGITFPVKTCTKCNISHLPLRSHHSSRCGYCIATFDHHCGMIGACIGESNHLKFLLFLLTQSINLLLSLIGLFETISNLLNKNNENYFLIPPSVFIVTFLLLFYFVFCSVLLGFHSYLILTNQTTFEIYHPTKCEYIELFRQEKKKISKSKSINLPLSYAYHPFDQGYIKNIKRLWHKQ